MTYHNKEPSPKLFITFLNKYYLDDYIEGIVASYTVLFDNIFVFTNSENDDEYILSYSIDHNNCKELPENTIVVQRKRKNANGDTINVLYSFNGLNELKRVTNNNEIDWDKYRNTIILTSSTGELRLLKTNLVKIVKLNN